MSAPNGGNTVTPLQNIMPRGGSVEVDAKLSYTRNADGSATGFLSYVDQNGIARKDGYIIDRAGIRFDDATVASYAQIARADAVPTGKANSVEAPNGGNPLVPVGNILPCGETREVDAELSYTRNDDGSATGFLSYIDHNGIAHNDGYIIDASGIRFDDATVASYGQIALANKVPFGKSSSGAPSGGNTLIPLGNILPRGKTVKVNAKLSYTRNSDGSATGTLSYIDHRGVSHNDGYIIGTGGIRFDDDTAASYAQIAKAPQ